MDFTGNCSLCLIWLRIQVETDHILLATVIDPGIHEDQFKKSETNSADVKISLSMTTVLSRQGMLYLAKDRSICRI